MPWPTEPPTAAAASDCVTSRQASAADPTDDSEDAAGETAVGELAADPEGDEDVPQEPSRIAAPIPDAARRGTGYRMIASFLSRRNERGADDSPPGCAVGVGATVEAGCGATVITTVGEFVVAALTPPLRVAVGRPPHRCMCPWWRSGRRTE